MYLSKTNLFSVVTKNQFNLFVISLIFTLVISGCAEKTYQMVYPTLSDGKYDSEFPYKNCSGQLEEISKSVKKINSLVFYKTYYLSVESKIQKKNLTPETLENNTIGTDATNESVSGTATVIFYDKQRIALLTCAHIVDFPDTIISYFENNYQTDKYIQSISIKLKQQNFVQGIPKGKNLEILAIDIKNDLAILGKAVDQTSEQVPVFSYPVGKSKELEWGNFVYIIGYPLGFQMITRGIVSNPDKIKSGSFLIDAVFNKGFSGGIVLAIKDGVPNFELVGIAKSASANYENYLKPSKDSHEFLYNPNIPYKGETFVHLKKNINYGVTYSISTETVYIFYKKIKKSLLDKGYNLDGFFN